MTDSLVNSASWWDQVHRSEWNESGGGEQTRMFMEALVTRLPAEVARVIREQELEIVDWGCATGEGAAVLKDAFPSSSVGGLDVAEAAIERARRLFPDLWFDTTEGTGLTRDFDVVVTSNCLEHFRAPLPIVREHLAHCRWYYVALVPYNEYPLHEQHFAQFREEAFPPHLAGFTRLAATVLTPPPAAWDGEQLLVVYASKQALAASGVAPDVSLGHATQLEDVAASVQLLVAERAWRSEASRIWKAYEERCRHMEDLQQRLDAGAAARDAAFAERSAALSSLERARAEQEAASRTRMTLEEDLAAARHEHAALEAELAAARHELAELAASLGHAQRDVAEVRSAHDEYRAWIEGSRVLRVTRALGNPKQLLFPKGSWRERHAWRLKLKALAAWHRLRGRQIRRPQVSSQSEELRFPAMLDDTVTVVLPVYNQADMLADGIQSVLAQSHGSFELIVLDDGSKDDVASVLDRFVDHPQVRVLRQPNAKLPKALSNAFEFALGQYWSWTSADNLMEPCQLEQQMASLRDHGDTGMVYGDYVAIDDRGEPLRDPSFRPHNRRSPTSEEIRLPRDVSQLNSVKDNFIGPCFMYRGVAGRALGEYDPRLGLEDYDYWMRMNHAFGIRHLGSDALLYRYRVHDNTLSARADELGIHAQANALMTYEKSRAEHHARALPIRIERPLSDHLSGIPDAQPVDDDAALAPGPALLLVSPSSLDRLAARGIPADIGVVAVAVVAGDVRDSFRHRVSMRRHADHCLALDPDSGEFLGLVHPQVWIAPDVAAALPALRAAWRNDSFYRSTRPPGLRERRLPRPYRGRALRLLLQVDRVGSGGMEHVVAEQAREMQRQGTEVVLAVIESGARSASGGLFDGLRVVDLSAAQDRRSAYAELLRDERIDVVNAHYSTFGADVAAAAAVPFVQTIHNTYVWLDAGQRAGLAASEPFTSAWLCVSDRVAYYAWRRLGLDARKMVVQVNPARELTPSTGGDPKAVIAAAGLDPKGFTFLNVASVYAAKAQSILIEALGRLAPDEPAQLLIIGATMDPAYKERLVARARALGVEARVAFIEHTDRIGDYYRAVDAFVLPSYWEGWSLAANEAAALGVPLLLARVGAAEEIEQLAGATLVDPPFVEVDELVAESLGRWLDRIDDAYVRRWTDAMRGSIHAPDRPRAERLRDVLSPSHVFESYTNVLGWVAQGGRPAAARVWAMQAWRRADREPGRAFQRSLLTD